MPKNCSCSVSDGFGLLYPAISITSSFDFFSVHDILIKDRCGWTQLLRQIQVHQFGDMGPIFDTTFYLVRTSAHATFKLLRWIIGELYGFMAGVMGRLSHASQVRMCCLASAIFALDFLLSSLLGLSSTSDHQHEFLME